MSIKIVTDSTADIPPHIAEDLGITVLPVYVNIGGNSYLDGVELTREEFYKNLPTYGSHPKTSAPSLGSVVEAYERLAGEGATQILSIHVALTLSGVQNVAHAAAQLVKSAAVTVFDSQQLTLGLGFQALAAAKAAALGRSMGEILEMLQGMVHRVYSFAALDTLEYLRRGGRLGRVQASVGNLLRIKPLLLLYEGGLTLEKTRTTRGVFARLYQSLRGLAPLENLAVVHAGAREKADELWSQVRHLVPGIDTPITAQVTPAIGVHVGPGAVGLVCVRAVE
ncbi:MAG: DegV family protein [Anaerolineae bacterium]|nr:DegV family protein [Anaerolineae bacterium]